MARPMLDPSAVVTAQAAVLRDVGDHPCPCRQVQHARTGRIVLPTKRLGQMARGSRASADNTKLSRVLAAAPGHADARHRRRESLVVSEAPRGDHVGRLVEHVDGPYHHRDGTSPWAPHPVTRVYGSGPGRFPLARRLSRRDAALPQGAAEVAQPVPDLAIPTANQARTRLPTQVAPVLLQAPEGRDRPEPCRTRLALALDWVEDASGRQVPCGGVVLDAWSVAEDVVPVLTRRRQAWRRRLATHRRLDTASVHRREAHGWTLPWPGPPIAVEALVPWLPAQASGPVPSRAAIAWGVTLPGRIAGLGQGRRVVSVAHASWTGRAVVLVTTRVDWNAATIIRLAWQRWPTATFDPDRQGHLGGNASRMRRAEARGQQGGLVSVADARWHLTCLPIVPDRPQGLMHTMGDACRPQGRAVWPRLLLFVQD